MIQFGHQQGEADRVGLSGRHAVALLFRFAEVAGFDGGDDILSRFQRRDEKRSRGVCFCRVQELTGRCCENPHLNVLGCAAVLQHHATAERDIVHLHAQLQSGAVRQVADGQIQISEFAQTNLIGGRLEQALQEKAAAGVCAG